VFWLGLLDYLTSPIL